ARASMTRSLATDGLPARLVARPDHPRWAEIAERCLACTSCTMVCPTCFCTSVTQVSDLDATHATSARQWDSCFTLGFGAVAGGNFRSRRQDRYRQWLTHKFATWVDQFGTSGCVGCGRCITWCPVGIDITEEVAAIRATEEASALDR
ncbi:MAG: 4Fe-4S dicluster domain-containing protein, partial [Solirubrobacteraceae bacterium]